MTRHVFYAIHFSLIGLCLATISGCGGASQDEVVAWIQSHGGRLEYDTARENRPVIRVVLTSQSVSDVSLIEHLEDLQELTLQGCPIHDLSPLAKLRRLRTLDVSSTHVSDVSPLARIQSLEVLNLHGTQVEDVDPLERMDNLRELVISDTQVAPRRAITLEGQLPNCSITW